MRPASVTLSSTVIAFMVLVGGYAAFLFMTRSVDPFLLSLIESPYVWVPQQLWPYFINGGVEAVAVSLGLLVGHGLALGIAGLLLGEVIGRWAFTLPEIKKKMPARSVDRLRFDTSEMPITVIAPGYLDPKSGKPQPARKLTTLYDDTQMRIVRAPVKPKRDPRNSIEHLELALIQTLYAHRNWTCDPAGHHADIGLYEHSKAVMQRMSELSTHPLARVIGWSHDIGKLLAYQIKDGKWISSSRRHDSLSSEIVRHFPEFWGLAEMDRRTVARVLTYAHADKLPRTLSDEARELISALKIADGLSTRDDKATSAKALDNKSIKEAVSRALLDAIPELNINNFQGSEHADGWTIEGVSYVAVLESAIRKAIGPRLEHRVALILQANVTIEGNRDHPMTKAIVSGLRDLSLLTERIDGNPPVEAYSGLFDIKSGRRKFIDVVLLDKEQVEKIVNPGLLSRWKSSGYTLRVLKSQREAEQEAEVVED